MSIDWKTMDWKKLTFEVISHTLRLLWLYMVCIATVIVLVEHIPMMDSEDGKVRMAIMVLLFVIANFTVIPYELFWKIEKKKEVPK